MNRCAVCGNRSEYCQCSIAHLDAQLATRCVECGNMWEYCLCIERPKPKDRLAELYRYVFGRDPGGR